MKLSDYHKSHMERVRKTRRNERRMNMQVLDFGICNNCGSVCTEESEGFEFYATFCPFCGRCYSRETTVDADYYASTAKREFPKRKDSYVNDVIESGGHGMIFVSVKDKEKFHSDVFKNDSLRYEPHITADCYGRGFYVELKPGEDIADMVRDLEGNLEIIKEKSYIAVYNDDGLKLMYGNKIDFNRETNYDARNIIKELQMPMIKLNNELRCKSDEARVQIEEKILEINRKIEELLTTDVLELIDITKKAPDKEMDANINNKDLPF